VAGEALGLLVVAGAGVLIGIVLGTAGRTNAVLAGTLCDGAGVGPLTDCAAVAGLWLPLTMGIELLVTAGLGTPVMAVFGSLPGSVPAGKGLLTDDKGSSGFGRETNRGLPIPVVKAPGRGAVAAGEAPIPAEILAESPTWAVGLTNCIAGDAD